jgi:putative acetyltransferase
MNITAGDLSSQAVIRFLEEHLAEMRLVTPPDSVHALDLDSLRKADITFWSVHEADTLVGCGALKQLDHQHGEIKSMRTSRAHRGQGIAAALLRHILTECQRRNYRRVSLETGAMPFFEPARKLYQKFGFAECEPFADYRPDPNSVFMSLTFGETSMPRA